MTPADTLLLDSNILIHYARDGASAKQIEIDHGLRSQNFRPTISIVTVGEVRAFAAIHTWGKRKTDIVSELLTSFTIIDINNESVIEEFVKLRVANQRGLNISNHDLWIAACAIAAGLTLMTTDRDFDRLPIGSISLLKIDQDSGKTIL